MALADRPAAAQFASDQRLLDALQGQPQSDHGVCLVCRLIQRYENCGPGSEPLFRQATAQLKAWGLDRRRAFALARQLWFSGYRPPLDCAPVGSGADVAAADG